MTRKNILIPLGEDSKDLKALHHALLLAKRIESQIFVLSIEDETESPKKMNPVIEACLDVINGACEKGLQVSFHIATEAELLKLLEREHIDLIIVSDTEILVEKMIRRIIPWIFCQVVQVRRKNDVNFIQ